jgi:hypothetical protein
MTWAEDVIDQARTAFGSGYARHNGREYTFPASSSEVTYDGAGFVMFEGAMGAIRLKVSELQKPYPKPGDDIEVKDVLSGDWETFSALDVTPQNNGATLRINYGKNHGR